MANCSNGYDIASYQGGIDNSKVSGDFVIVKATQGVNYTNPYMYNQIQTTKQAGKKLGLYHFANGGNWKAEADYFLRTVKPYMKGSILVLDYEGGAVPIGREIWAKNWLDYVYKQTGVKPMIYLGLADENAYNWKGYGVTNYASWIAQYNNMATVFGYKPRVIYGNLRNWKNMTMFQYTPSGKLDGWGGLLDLDVYYGKHEDWVNHTNNKTEDNKEMEFAIKVAPTDVGGFLITKKQGLVVWAHPDNTEKATDKKLGYNTSWRVSKFQDGFARVSKTTDKNGVVHEQWLDTSGGNYKGNPIRTKGYKSMTIFLKDGCKAKLHKAPKGETYGGNLPKGTKFRAVNYDPKTNYFGVKDTKGNLVYVNGEKFLVLLGGN